MLKSARGRLYRDAAIRKLRRLLGSNPDPYPPRPTGSALSPFMGHRAAIEACQATLPFRDALGKGGFENWQLAARVKLLELMGVTDQTESVSETVRGPVHELEHDISRETVYLRVRPETDVPVTLVSHSNREKNSPVFIHLAGSTSGVHLGWGEARIPIDHLRLEAGSAMALEAARRGYLAVCIEQAGYGERAERALSPRSSDPVVDAANHSLLIGRCLLGEKTMDLSAVLDWLATQREVLSIDISRLFLFGHSAGGSMALYGSALDTRIAGVLCSGSVGRIHDTLGTRRNSNGSAVVPGILKWFETEDIVAMIAPRPFIALSGVRDHIYPAAGAADVVDRARPAYEQLNAGARLEAISCNGPHRYYSVETWQAWDRIMGQP